MLELAQGRVKEKEAFPPLTEHQRKSLLRQAFDFLTLSMEIQMKTKIQKILVLVATAVGLAGSASAVTYQASGVLNSAFGSHAAGTPITAQFDYFGGGGSYYSTNVGGYPVDNYIRPMNAWTLTVGSETLTVPAGVNSVIAAAPGEPQPGAWIVGGGTMLTTVLPYYSTTYHTGDPYDYAKISVGTLMNGKTLGGLPLSFGSVAIDLSKYNPSDASPLASNPLLGYAGTLSLLSKNSAGAVIGSSGFTISSLTPVPEPSTYAMMLLGAFGLTLATRRRGAPQSA